MNTRPKLATRQERPERRYWGDLEVPKHKRDFFNAVTQPSQGEGAKVATIRLYGPIDSWGGWWGVSAKDFTQVLDQLPDTIEQIILRINSPGGEVWEGVTILNLLRAHAASVTAVVDGLAASAASVIAAGCDEVVMSPGTQMMIHSPWVITWGNATDLRKSADVLDTIEASLIEVYEAKAGANDWPALLAEETWLTAKEAVQMGLADRVAVIPDAGEATTLADDDTDATDPSTADPEDSMPLRHLIAAHAAQPNPGRVFPETSATESTKGGPAMSDTFIQEVRARLELPEDATEEQVLGAIDERTATPTTAALPDGVVTIEADQLEQMRADAAAGRAARDAQIRAEREALVVAAISDGRIAPARREAWVAALEADDGAAESLAALQPGLIPLEPNGYTGGIDEAADEDSDLYTKAWGTRSNETKGA